MEGRSEQYERKLGEKEDGENDGKEKEKTTQGRRARNEDIEHCDEDTSITNSKYTTCMQQIVQ